MRCAARRRAGRTTSGTGRRCCGAWLSAPHASSSWPRWRQVFAKARTSPSSPRTSSTRVGTRADRALRADSGEVAGVADAGPPGEDVGLFPLEHRRVDVGLAGQHARLTERRERRGEVVGGHRCRTVLFEHTVSIVCRTRRSTVRCRSLARASPAKAPIPRSAVVSSLRVIRRKIRKPMTHGGQRGHQQHRRKGVERGRRRGARGVVDLHRHRLGRRTDGQVAHQHEVVDHVGEHQHRAGEDRGHQHRQRDAAQRPERPTRRDPLRPLRIACRWWPAGRAPAPPGTPPGRSPGRRPARRCRARWAAPGSSPRTAAPPRAAPRG